MDQLIELITGNSWIFIIIIAIVSSMFNRSGKKESESTTPIPLPKSLRPFFEMEDEEDQPREVKKELRERNAQHIEEVTEPENTKNIFQTYLDMQDKNETENTKTVEHPAPVAIKKPIGTQRSYKGISKSKVAEGIIWSEVLGPSRAKKPFQRRH